MYRFHSKFTFCLTSVRTHLMLSMSTGRRVLTGVLIFVVALVLVKTSWAVSVTTSTFATQSNPPTVTAQHPLTTFTNPTNISSSVRSDENTAGTNAAHAQAWASATVSLSGVTKSASGNGWLNVGLPTVKAETWSSSASGSQYMVSGSP